MRTFTALECAVQSPTSTGHNINIRVTIISTYSISHQLIITPGMITILIPKWSSSHHLITVLVISNHSQNINPTLTGHNINIQVIIISSSSISHQFVITLGMVTWPQLPTISAHRPQKINLTSTGHNIYIQVNIISTLFL